MTCGASEAADQIVEGPARVVDGDTLEVRLQPDPSWLAHAGVFLVSSHPSSCILLLAERRPRLQVSGEKIRLFGLDAPEKAQSCSDQGGRPYACGAPSLLFEFFISQCNGTPPLNPYTPSHSSRVVLHLICPIPCVPALPMLRSSIAWDLNQQSEAMVSGRSAVEGGLGSQAEWADGAVPSQGQRLVWQECVSLQHRQHWRHWALACVQRLCYSIQVAAPISVDCT